MEAAKVTQIIERINDRNEEDTVHRAQAIIREITESLRRITELEEHVKELRKELKELTVPVVDPKTILGE